MLITSLSSPATAILQAEEYHIGPEKTYKVPGDFPWESIKAGDIVNIYWRELPYKSMFVLCCQGTKEKPVVVRGIAGPDGKLPVILGHQAIVRTQLSYNNKDRAILKIGPAYQPSGAKSEYLLVDGIEFRGASPTNTFISTEGVKKFSENAAGIYLERGENITIRNCLFRECANGLFVAHESKNILVDRCSFIDNGRESSIYEHNMYIAATGITVQNCFLGPLRKNCPGNNLKDRSAGLVVRYNWIEGGNRQLDLVDAEDSELIRKDPRYSNTLVYGNLLLERANDGNKQIVHYGGDSDRLDFYRKGTLYFFHNTLVSERDDATCLFMASTGSESIVATNNIFYASSSGKNISLLEKYGKLEFTNNWICKGYRPSFEPDFKGVISEGDILTGEEPLFLNLSKHDFRLKPESPCLNQANQLHKELSRHKPEYYPDNKLTLQPRLPLKLSIGAYDKTSD